VPKLDRKFVGFHPENLNYPIRELLVARERPAVKLWPITAPGFPLNQLQEGACVAHGWAGELAADPVRYRITQSWTWDFWKYIQMVDKAMGNDFGGEGATVLAGAKAARNMGMVGTFRWALTLNDILDTAALFGPVVMGVNWYESMYDTDENGLLTIAGDIAGGHCILINGYYKEHPIFGECVQLMNSWGPTWGVGGVGYLRVPDLRRLRSEQGEFCVATDIVRK
jgi:hypothetical protein